VRSAPRTSPARTARAGLFAAVAVGLVVVLRARSDGPRPGVILLLGAMIAITLLIRPLTGRERRMPSLLLGLVGVQLALRAGFLLASTGHLTHAGTSGLFCSPAAPGPAALSCLPTERGGWALFAVQLLAAAVFAGWLRDVEGVSWQLTRLFRRGTSRLAARVASVWAVLSSLAESIRIAIPAALGAPAPVRIGRPTSDVTQHRLVLSTRSSGRRGPPSGLRLQRNGHAVAASL
jgi:hypothetical protein